MHKVIDDILTSTRRRVADLHAAYTDAPKKIEHRDIIPLIRLRKCENRIPVISEVKPGSPTTDKREITPDDAARIAQEMEAAGAVAISVLTEPAFFGGSMENLSAVRRAVSIPVLRKDFIIDEKQIYETESDLILLIAGILGNNLEQFVDLAITRGIEPLVEVHDKSELSGALNTEARIIGVNNRKLIPADRIIISESGTRGPPDAVRMIRVGADAILVGTTVMDAPFDKTLELVDAL